MKYKIILLLKSFLLFIYCINKNIYLKVRRKTLSTPGKANNIILINKQGQKIYNPKLKKISVEFKGKNNTVIIHEPFNINSLEVICWGDNSILDIGHSVKVEKTLFVSMGQNSFVKIGNNTSLYSVKLLLSSTENSKILIGNDCMFSYNIEFRTCDDHTIYDINTKEVLNPSEDIVIGNHVWITAGARIFKGAGIASNCIIGANSIVTKCFTEENCIVAGIPAKVIKRNVNWHRCRPHLWNSYKDFV